MLLFIDVTIYRCFYLWIHSPCSIAFLISTAPATITTTPTTIVTAAVTVSTTATTAAAATVQTLWLLFRRLVLLRLFDSISC